MSLERLLFTAILFFWGIVGASKAWHIASQDFRRFRLERRNAKAMAKMKAEFESRPRGKILKVGHIASDPYGQPIPKEFMIDCLGHIPPMTHSPWGELMIGGWTITELAEIAKRPEEFVCEKD